MKASGEGGGEIVLVGGRVRFSSKVDFNVPRALDWVVIAEPPWTRVREDNPIDYPILMRFFSDDIHRLPDGIRICSVIYRHYFYISI